MVASRFASCALALALACITSEKNVLAQENNETTTSTIAPNNDSSWYIPANYSIPPWGISSFGFVDTQGSHYRKAAGFADIVRPGWSWTRREMKGSAPFCYDSLPLSVSTCYTSVVQTMCEELGGTATYEDNFCLSKRPFQVLGPVCWNETCYGEETQAACDSVGGFFVGGIGPGIGFITPDGVVHEVENAAWCVIPGSSHTIVGPACYGKECFTEELAAACLTMGGTNFADRFCLVDISNENPVTVIGPVCTPISGPIEEASTCHPEETKKLCNEMNGTSIGDIFCVVKGDYSVLGPFCSAQHYETEPGQIYADCVNTTVGETACSELGGHSVGQGMFCVLSGNDYHLLGPLCTGDGGCWVYDDSASPGGENSCAKDFGGTSVGYHSCIIQGDYTIVGPSIYGNVKFRGDNILADDLKEPAVFSPIEGDASWYVLNGTYSVFGPTCYATSCFDGDCIKAGGSRINSIFCVMGESQTEAAGSSSGATSLLLKVSFLCIHMLFVALYHV